MAKYAWRSGYATTWGGGIAFVIAGILGSGADFLIRSYINNVANIDTVGLFNAGYMMTMTYVGMVFAAMETDFFLVFRVLIITYLHLIRL